MEVMMVVGVMMMMVSHGCLDLLAAMMVMRMGGCVGVRGRVNKAELC